MARFNNKKLQTQRNFQSIWHSQPEYIGTLLKEDQHIREYIIGTMKAKGWKLSEIIIKRKVKQIHIAFQIQMGKIGKERKRWTKNRLKNRINAKGSGNLFKRSKNTQGVYLSLAVKSRLRKIAIKKRFLFFQLYLMIMELRKMYPHNQISFYIQKTKPLQFNANLINSWIIENIKKKKSYKRLINRVISKFKNSQKLNFIHDKGLALKRTNEKEFLSWITGNLTYLYRIHNQVFIEDKNKQNKWASPTVESIRTSRSNLHSLFNESLLLDLNTKEHSHQRLKSSELIKFSRVSGHNLGSLNNKTKNLNSIGSIWLKWRDRYGSSTTSRIQSPTKSGTGLSARKNSKPYTSKHLISSLSSLSKNLGVQLASPTVESIRTSRSLENLKRIPYSSTDKRNKKDLKKNKNQKRRGPFDRADLVLKRSLSSTASLLGENPRRGPLGLCVKGQFKKEFKGLNFNKFKTKTKKLNPFFKKTLMTPSSRFSAKLKTFPSFEGKPSTIGGGRIIKLKGLSQRLKNLRLHSAESIKQDLRSAWKLMRKNSHKQIARKLSNKVNLNIKGVLKHRKELNEDILLLLNYYKLVGFLNQPNLKKDFGLSSRETGAPDPQQSCGPLTRSEGFRRGRKLSKAKTLLNLDYRLGRMDPAVGRANLLSLNTPFLWQGKIFINWLQSHPALLDHIIKCLVSSPKNDSLIEYLTRVWVGIFDYINHYENSSFKWQGIRILLSGRVGYKKMGRAKKYSNYWGSLKNSSARLPLQYAYSQHHTRYGVVGVKVFVR